MYKMCALYCIKTDLKNVNLSFSILFTRAMYHHMQNNTKHQKRVKQAAMTMAVSTILTLSPSIF